MQLGILDAMSGRNQAVNSSEVAQELEPILLPGEQVGAAFRVMRDMLVFTDRRLVSIDRQGLTGKKVDYRSVPYSSITMFSKESAGVFDMDAELKLWVRGLETPLVFHFNKDAPINDVYRLVSEHILS
jgi:hypothetical protein